MAIRHVSFDMNDLAKRAAEAVSYSHTQCDHVEKFPDGMFNKSFLSTTQDCTQAAKSQIRTLGGRTIPLPAKWPQ
ncbi:hypothetical protein BDV29DRAFT_171905 [Aspergillus leporis]|uniref:Uncharacterized protein n=1 Tax=Aspergillus leporis TaxID=41062 RepID=A0A5N5X422_9EURO|nr:hypothetical protein BDV29DRAFT_171905 [Aspergillus leporis]